jgi:hypothetical protein
MGKLSGWFLRLFSFRKVKKTHPVYQIGSGSTSPGKRKTALKTGRFWGDFEAKSAFLASLAGFEPATRCLEGSRSILLSYRDQLIIKCNRR